MILSELSAVVSGKTTAEDIVSAVDVWFSAGKGSGGFLDTAYSGSIEHLSGLIVSDDEQVTLPATAADDALRNTLKGFAITALIARDLVPTDPALRQSLVKTAGTQLLASDDDLSHLRASVGVTEAKISNAQTANKNEETALGLARAELVNVDEYETATALKAVESQMKTLYTLTARLSDLSLTDYI
ncbi:flagellin [Paenirhodobacter sp.]|uniref:flagellin n=1 Tax=Paenirhodobacter sp. TaxID=1965326 RepID=UPI003B3C9D84